MKLDSLFELTKISSRIAITLITACCCSGCRSTTYMAPSRVNLNSKLVAPDIGSGDYLYQFELKDASGDLQPNEPFALSLTHDKKHRTLPFVKDEKGVYQGITDDAGRTPIVALDFSVPDKNWRLRKRVGSGPYGEDFRLTTKKTLFHHSLPESGMEYTLVVCDDPPRHYSGVSDSTGLTAFVATDKPLVVLLFAGLSKDNDESARESCKASQ